MKKNKWFNKAVIVMMVALMASLYCYTDSTASAASKKPTLVKKQANVLIGQSTKIRIKHVSKNAKIKYKSLNNSVAAVNKKGRVTAKKPGTTKIKITIKQSKKNRTLKYTVKVKKPTLSNNALVLRAGENSYLYVDDGPASESNTDYIWESSDNSIVSVNDGDITAKKEGSAVIRVKVYYAGKCVSTLSATINVFPKEGEVNNNLSQDEFAQTGADLIKQAGSPSSTAIMEDGEFVSKRLIVQCISPDMDFTSTNPVMTVGNKDGLFLLQYSSADSAKAAMAVIKNWDKVKWVEPDSYDVTNADENTGVSSKSWGVSMINADKYAKSIASNRDTLIVGVVDTGVSQHAFLSGRIQSGGYDFVGVDNDPNDEHYHGTHVAGTIVDCTPGLNIKVLPVRVLNEKGSGSSFNVGNGIKYAADHGAKVINLSLGGDHSYYKDDSIEYAIKKGVTVCVAAGNDNIDTAYYCPAHITNAITVAAINDKKNKASFSNYGSAVDVAAPGVGIVSCVPGGSYKSLNGTSMATPHVSAVAAMIKLNEKNLTPAQIEKKIRDCAVDLGDAGWDKYYGYGVPDCNNLLKIQPTGIALDRSSVSVEVGKTTKLTATVSPSNASDKTVTWSSNNSSIAKVSSNGTITGVAEGSTTIIAKTVNGKTASCVVTVMAPETEPTGITLDRSSVSVEVGKTTKIIATVSPSNASDKTVTWSSNNSSIAKVSSNGTVTGMAEGNTTIIAKTVNGKSASCMVTVIENNESDKIQLINAQNEFEDIWNGVSRVKGKTIVSRADGMHQSINEVLEDAIYDGTAYEPPVSVSVCNDSYTMTGLERGKDYTISYSNNINAGNAQIIITGKGNYTGTIRIPFEIKPYSTGLLAFWYDYSIWHEEDAWLEEGTVQLGCGYDLAWCLDRTYTGSEITHDGIYASANLGRHYFTDSGSIRHDYTSTEYTTLKKGKDYTISYSNNTDIGTATIIMKPLGNISGSTEYQEFNILAP